MIWLEAAEKAEKAAAVAPVVGAVLAVVGAVAPEDAPLIDAQTYGNLQLIRLYHPIAGAVIASSTNMLCFVK